MSDLPTKISKGAPVKLSELTWFLYGPPGIGKSTLASGFVDGPKRPLYLWTSSVKYIGGVFKRRIGEWSNFTNAVKVLQGLDGKRYSVIVVDTIDLLWMHAREEVLDQRGIEHETDLSHGKGFDMVRREFIPEIAKLCTCGYGVIFVSHAQARDFGVTRAIKEQRIVPSLQDSAKRIVLPVCDIEGYLGFSTVDVDETDGARKIFFEPTGDVEAKDWTGKLPYSMVLSADAAENAKKLVKFLKAPAPARTKVRKKKGKTRRRVVKRRE